MDGPTLVLAPSAYRTTERPEDIIHAYRKHMRRFAHDDEGLIMTIGPDFAGRLLEVGYVVSDDGAIVIVHAMPARRHLLKGL